MNYIGGKRRLLSFIHDTMKQHNIAGQTLCDLFAGSAVIGEYFKQQGYRIIANDALYYSYILQYVKVKLNTMPTFDKLATYLNVASSNITHYAATIIDYLNQVEGIKGFIYQHYTADGTQHLDIPRTFYTSENAQKIDAIRELIESWNQLAVINTDEYCVLLYSLLEAAQYKENTVGMQSAFLKHFKRKDKRTALHMKLPTITASCYQHEIHTQDSLAFVENMPKVDVLYLDPPYTGKQYSAYYHLSETIARWDNPTIKGVAGQRNTESLRSPLCSKRYALDALTHIVKQERYQHLLLSYSSEGIIPHECIINLLSQFGELSVHRQPIERFNSRLTGDPARKPHKTVEERLYYLKPKKETVIPMNSNPYQTKTFNVNTCSLSL